VLQISLEPSASFQQDQVHVVHRQYFLMPRNSKLILCFSFLLIYWQDSKRSQVLMRGLL